MEKFQPVNDLEKSLLRAAKSRFARSRFYRDLMESDIYVVPLTSPAIRCGNIPAKEKLQLMGFVVNDAFFIAFFSSEERAAEAAINGTGCLRIAAKDFFEMTRGSYLVLNPNSSLGKEFFPAEIEQMLASAPVKDTNKNVA